MVAKYPKVICNDRVIILRDIDEKLIFYDVKRQKIFSRCKIEKIYDFCVIGDDLIIGIGEEYDKNKKYYSIALPYS